MVLIVGSASFLCRIHNRRNQTARAVASEEFATVKSEKDKVKLGGSDLKEYGEMKVISEHSCNHSAEFYLCDQIIQTAEIILSGYIDGLGDAVEMGLVKAVGVSNYSAEEERHSLASNQVNYSLIYRAPEENGVKAACDELGAALITYSPIAQGVLTGKYTPENPPNGPRGRIYTPKFLRKMQPLLRRIKEIGENYSETPTQVVLNWLIAQENVVTIPGAKDAEQAQEFAGALGWKLTDDEIAELRLLASEIRPGFRLPFENL
ncbi:hypothetical protein ACLOJK_021679 [Asimina triloba]